MSSKTYSILVLATILTACGGGTSSVTPSNVASTETKTPVDEEAVEDRTCMNIRPSVIQTAAQNGLNIVKIYDPKTILNNPKKVSCSGRALVGSGQEARIYYRSYEDADGDRLVEYNEKRLD